MALSALSGQNSMTATMRQAVHAAPLAGGGGPGPRCAAPSAPRLPVLRSRTCCGGEMKAVACSDISRPPLCAPFFLFAAARRLIGNTLPIAHKLILARLHRAAVAKCSPGTPWSLFATRRRKDAGGFAGNRYEIFALTLEHGLAQYAAISHAAELHLGQNVRPYPRGFRFIDRVRQWRFADDQRIERRLC